MKPASNSPVTPFATPFRIGINAHLLNMDSSYRSAGVSNYIENLLLGLSEVDKVNQYHLFTDVWAKKRRLTQDMALGKNFRWHPSRYPTTRPQKRILWEQTVQPLSIAKMDIVHGMSSALPLWQVGQARRILTIHDLVFLVFDDKHGMVQRRYLETVTRLSIDRADKVIAVSENTKRDIVRLLGVPEEKIVVIPEAAGPEYRPLPSAEVAEFRRAKGLPERFLLSLGTLEPRKNIKALLYAYAELRVLMGSRTPPLFIAGGKGWHYDDIFQTVQKLKLQDDVTFPGFVPREEVALWVNAATVFIYLSEYEGFGLPPLQAMACGVPVVVNNASSLPEVVGDAGYLVDASDANGVALKLRALSEDEALWQCMSEKALRKSAEFSWAKAARQTLAVYEEVLAAR